MPFINGAVPSNYLNMTIKVTNFDSIASMQYVIRWNPTVLKYSNINNFGAVPGLDIQDFNTGNAIDSGYVKLLWEAPNVTTGVSLPDSTTIFRLRFFVVGADTSSTPVQFTELTNTFPIIDFEVTKVVGPNGAVKGFDENECFLTNGFVAVGFTVATGEPSAADAFGLNIAPNPFVENTQATFSLQHKADVQVQVADATGRIVFQQDMPGLLAGQHQIDLDKAIFPSKGAYFLTVRAGSEMSVRSLISF